MTKNHDKVVELERIMSEIKKIGLLCYDFGTNPYVLDEKAVYECLECPPQLRRLCKDCKIHHHRSGKSKTHVSRLL